MNALLRHFLLLLLFSAPAALFGAAILFPQGAVIGLAAGGGLLFLLEVLAEKLVLRRFADRGLPALEARQVAEAGLERTCERVFGTAKFPRIVVFPQPVPDAFVVRSRFGRGTILLSQGLVSSLREDELRAVLLWGDRRCRQRGTMLQTVCGLLASRLLDVAPGDWTEAMTMSTGSSARPGASLGPFSAFGFLPFYGLSRMVLSIGGGRSSEGGRSADESPSFQGAVRKIDKAGRFWSSNRSHAFSRLRLNSPPEGDRLLPL